MENEGSSAAQAVSRTVWLLGQLRGYSSKQALADAMGWDRSRLSRTLSGDRQWTLEDLEVAARVLDLAGPGELFRPLAELVGAVAPVAVANSRDTEVNTGRYPRASSLRANQMAQVIALRPSYQTVTGNFAMTPSPVTRLDASHRGQHADTA